MTTTLLVALVLLSADRAEVLREWDIEGVKRQAAVFAPKDFDKSNAKTKPPLVFAFHGHGGGMRNAARTFRYHQLWPEAVVVYMQGLPTAGITDPEGKKPGWQQLPGNNGDRDLKFFDAVLASMKKHYSIDEDRVYSTGHSNGGAFTYQLWGAREHVFAAIAPSSAPGLMTARNAKPLPVMHIGGVDDRIVPIDAQKRTIEMVKKINGCESKGKEWAKGCEQFESPGGNPVVALIHPGGHKFLDDAPELVVRFFKEHKRRE